MTTAIAWRPIRAQFCLLLLCLLPAGMATAQSSISCETLSRLELPQVIVNDAQEVGSGSFQPPGSSNQAQQFNTLPSFCQISLTLVPSDDSSIGVEIWLPLENWNGKYMAVGNGAFNGSIAYPALAAALERGYATSSTDTGHSGNTAEFGLGHPEKIVDFGWRAVHEMTVTAKTFITAFYAQAPRYAYWNGCSAGGRQAMKEAQRFPEDFDGIIAGAPGLDWTGRATAALRIAQHLTARPTASFDEADLNLLAASAIAACDVQDGVNDGLIGRPAQCRFDPASLVCAADATQSCLNPDQAQAAAMIYSSPLNPATGRAITGLLPGSEKGWTSLGWTASARATGLEQLRYLVYGDPLWDLSRFDFDTDVVLAESSDGDTINALNPDLGPYFARNGKLIQYHGWSDPQISPANSTQYYQRVSDLLGGREAIHHSYRLFMAPGMGHCSGGEGPNTFDMVTALETWVEQGRAPDSILATRSTSGTESLSRPLCPYPEEAVYSGTGSTDSAENFSCRMP